MNFLMVCCRDKVKSLSRITASRKKCLSRSAQPASLKIIKHSEDKKVLWLRKLLHKAHHFHDSVSWSLEATVALGLGTIFQVLILLFYGAINVPLLTFCNVYANLEAALLTSFPMVLSYLSNFETIQSTSSLCPPPSLLFMERECLGKKNCPQKVNFGHLWGWTGVKICEMQFLHCAYWWLLVKVLSLNGKKPASTRNWTNSGW